MNQNIRKGKFACVNSHCFMMRSFVARNKRMNELFSEKLTTVQNEDSFQRSETVQQRQTRTDDDDIHDRPDTSNAELITSNLLLCNSTTQDTLTATTYYRTASDSNLVEENNDVDDDNDTASSSSSSDESILSDTEDTKLLMKEQEKHWFQQQRYKNTENEQTDSISKSDDLNMGKNSNDHSIAKVMKDTSYRIMKSKKMFVERIEHKLKRQLYYRNQIWDHLLRIYFPKQKGGKSALLGTKVYFQSVMQREVQARYYKVDCVVQKILSRQEGKPEGTCKSTRRTITRYTNLEIEQIRRRLRLIVENSQPNTPPVFLIEASKAIPPSEAPREIPNITNQDEEMKYHKTHPPKLGSDATSTKTMKRWFQYVDLDDLLFGRHIVLPAMYTLIVHSIVHACLYDGILALIDILKSSLYVRLSTYLFGYTKDGDDIYSQIASIDFTVIWTIVLFLAGASLLRVTGDIYWWSSDSDYQLIKFDFHNRRQVLQLYFEKKEALSKCAENQGKKGAPKTNTDNNYVQYPICTMTRIVMWIRQYDCIRAVFFMFGYTICYIASYDIWRYITRWFIYFFVAKHWNYQNVISKLPSTIELTSNGICLADRHADESFCSNTCQNELERRATEFSTLKAMDMDFTRNVLSADSNDIYWNYWIHNVDMMKIDYPGSLIMSTTICASDGHYLSKISIGDLPPLFLKHQQMLYYCTGIFGSVVILYKCGVKMWKKY